MQSSAAAAPSAAGDPSPHFQNVIDCPSCRSRPECKKRFDGPVEINQVPSPLGRAVSPNAKVPDLARPVFFDPTGRRRRVFRFSILALLVLFLCASTLFATTVVDVPNPAPLPIGFERMAPLPFRAQVGRIRDSIQALLASTHRRPAAKPTGGQTLTVGFYTTWGDDSIGSLRRSVDRLSWVAPTLMSLDASGNLVIGDDPAMRRIIAGSLHRPLVMPVLQNAAGGKWDGEAATRIMRDPVRRKALVSALSAALARSGDAGVIFDFENLPPGSERDLVKLVSETRDALSPQGRLVAVTMPIDSPQWPARELAAASDKLILMAYDEHWQGGTPGPIASDAWFVRNLQRTIAGIAPAKLVVALGNYGYDWHDGAADAMTVEEAWLAAHDSGTAPVFDPVGGNTGFSFEDDGHRHDVWFLDAAASWNQLHALGRLGLRNVALWRLGSEDPGFWPVLANWRANRPLPALSTISQQSNVDVEGQGEILRVSATPSAGQRRLAVDPGGLVRNETYGTLPTPFVVQRTGARDRLVALTFDDGPDPAWTPRILSVLESEHVPATFFVVGENGIGNAGLLRRMVADGDEIGNHSYTHPNMAEEAETGVDLELNATQRLVEAFTGRSTRLFRAPYFGDAEPTTTDELAPALIAQRRGYTVVGLHVDPGDWKRPGADAIVERTIGQVEHPGPDRSSNIVLLHDGGGDRAQTVAALPRIIERLTGDGYRLVPVSTLAGLDYDAVMPRVEGMDLTVVRADLLAFSLLGDGVHALDWLFFFAIALGIARSLLLALLAVTARKPVPSKGPASPGRVTVIVPAYNEERVIEAAVTRILESDYPDVEVIVADDGSRDRTSAIVATVFASEPRVRLLTLENGGKASALNRALVHASGSIIVALDADTQFEPGCISSLVRWFADPDVGAVAGNAKVGNRVNLVTRWQAIEYVTAQNLERRALARLDAIMVVPGAVGAWRRDALGDVGGYPEDTLAEDQDLTIAIQRAGWKVIYDEDAVAWTEAPEGFGALARQRFRWSFGTLQCLWKHRSILRTRSPGGLAFVGFPQAWLFQIVFAVVSPLIDLALLVSIAGTAVRVAEHGWAQTQTDVLRLAAYWVGFTAIDLVCASVAWRLDMRERRMPALLLLAQRIVYRQLMYGVVIRAVGAALAGLGIGWGKLERTGRVAPPRTAAPLEPGQADRCDEPAPVTVG